MTTPGPSIRPQLDLAFARRGDRTILERRLFRWPFVLTRTFALDAAPRHMLTAILQTGSGAMHGDDRLHQRIAVGRDAAAHVTTQGATPVHRADGDETARETVRICVAEGGALEYIPEPRILFPDAALSQRIEIDCAIGGVALVADAFTIHDPAARGRGFRRFASTTILIAGSGQPVLNDRFDITNIGSGRTAQFDAFGSMVLAAPGHLGRLEELADAVSTSLAAIPGLYGAASLLPAPPVSGKTATEALGQSAGVGVRLAGRNLRAVRAGLHCFWIETRRHLYGISPPPRRKRDDAGLRRS